MNTFEQFGLNLAFAPSPRERDDDQLAAAAAPTIDERLGKRITRRVGKQSTEMLSGQMDFFASDVAPDRSNDSAAVTGSLRAEVAVTAPPPEPAPAERPRNFAEALALVETSGVFSEAQLQKHRSHVNVAAKALQKVERDPDPTLIPCEPRLLREMLMGFHPAQARIKREQWASIVSGLRRILRMTGWLRPVSRVIPRSAAWETILADIDNEAQRAAIRKFANFATSISVEPHAVGLDTFAAYREWLEDESLTLTHRGIANGAAQTWRRLCREHPAWGIAPPPKQQRYNLVATRKEELPASFHASTEAYLARCAQPDPFDLDFGHALAAETLRKRRTFIFLGAQYLLELGWPAERLDHIRALCTPEAVGGILREQFRRHSPDGKTWPPGAKPMASHLQIMARQIGELTDAELAQVEKFAGHVPRARRGFPKKTRERLAVFDDERVLRDFMGLPRVLWQEATELAKSGRVRQARAKAKYAIALAILLTRPLRIGELASIDFAGDFRRDRKGRIVGLHIPGERTKTGVPSEADIDQILGKRISEFFEKFVRPVSPPGESYLFLADRGGAGHVDGSDLGAGLKREIWRHLGITFNAHLARALVATIILDADPNGGPIAQRMLGNMRLETTVGHYGMQRGRTAQRLYETYLSRTLRGRGS